MVVVVVVSVVVVVVVVVSILGAFVLWLLVVGCWLSYSCIAIPKRTSRARGTDTKNR